MKYTDHAKQRCSQRSISEEQAEFVIENGGYAWLHAGRKVYFCGNKTDRSDCKNIAVITETEGEELIIVSVIKTRDLKRFRKNVLRGRTFHI